MLGTKQIIKACSLSSSRFDFWIRFIKSAQIKKMAEIGIWSGEFAWNILDSCTSIDTYYMIDPWRHLSNLDNPSNTSNDHFRILFDTTITNTNFAKEKRIILRGKTTEVINKIPDYSLDFAYIDGDHTLKGITIDLISIYNKIWRKGWIAGHDFDKTIWQHGIHFEPNFIFPFAVYFAEAVNERIFSLPYNHFLIEKNPEQSFVFIDLIGKYNNITLKNQLIKKECNGI